MVGPTEVFEICAVCGLAFEAVKLARHLLSEHHATKNEKPAQVVVSGVINVSPTFHLYPQSELRGDRTEATLSASVVLNSPPPNYGPQSVQLGSCICPHCPSGATVTMGSLSGGSVAYYALSD